MLQSNRDEISSQLSKLQITNYLKQGGLQFFTSPIFSLSLALVNADIPAAIEITSKLAGLGVGLTPAGDDFIMGALYAAWIIHPPEIARVLAHEIAESAVGLTTSLSAAWIRSAGRGEAGQLWHELFEVLITRVESDIQRSVGQILSVGETSGADALVGFTSVFANAIDRPAIPKHP
jgi:hypothetical protein